MPNQSLPDISLPSGWGKNVKAAVLHVISLAQYALTYTRGWAADALNPRARQAAESERVTNEVGGITERTRLLREELRIKDARIAKIDPRRRPYSGAPVVAHDEHGCAEYGGPVAPDPSFDG